MKKIFSICAMFSVILFGACTDVDTAGETPEVPGTPEEPVVAPEIPVVPAGFDWSTETGVNLTLESGVTTNVSVYSEEDCQDNSLLLEDVLLESDVARTFRMAVPGGETLCEISRRVGCRRCRCARRERCGCEL